MRFAGKVAFISGASKGIGLACAERLCSEGASVFLTASNAQRLASAEKHLHEVIARTEYTKGTVTPTVAYQASDLRTLEGCTAAADAAVSNYGVCDILINSAGATKGGVFPGQADEDMLDGFALKFHGAVRLSRLLWPHLCKANGSVLNVVGGFARTPAADFMVGGAVNAALANFSKALADKGLQDDVNVNWIHPGLTVTDRLETIFEDRAQQQNKTASEVEAELVSAEGIRRLGQPEEVASLVAFLCSPEARHIHGTGIAIDGGGGKGYY